MADDNKRSDLSIDIEDKKSDVRADEAKDTMSSGVTNNPAISIAAYCGSSILMTTTNKYVMSGVDFNLSFFLLFIQAGVCVLAIEGCKRMGFITYRDFNTDEAKKWFPVSLAFIGMIYTGTWAIKYLSIPVFTIFKNLTIILIAYGEVLWFGGSVAPLALFSFGLIVLSSVVAAWADVQHALTAHDDASGKQSEALSTLNTGYVWMMLNCFCSALYVLGMRKRIKLTNFKDFDTMFYNNLLILPIVLGCSVLLEDWSSPNLQKNFPPDARNSVIMAMLISGLGALFISYTSAWCVRVTSSTTYSMVGALNKLPIALSGLVFFDAPITFGSVTAIFLGFISGIVYSVAKVRQSQAQREVLPMPASTVSASSRSAQDGLKA